MIITFASAFRVPHVITEMYTFSQQWHAISISGLGSHAHALQDL